jgi:hypothetical protein
MGIKTNPNDHPLLNFAKGFITGFTEAIICYPTEYIKTQLQLQSTSNPQFKGIVDCAVQTVKEGGPLALYRGALPLYVTAHRPLA